LRRRIRRRRKPYPVYIHIYIYDEGISLKLFEGKQNGHAAAVVNARGEEEKRDFLKQT
jgi:hypothetical protein